MSELVGNAVRRGSHSDDAGTTVWALVPAPPLQLHGLPDYGELENTG